MVETAGISSVPCDDVGADVSQFMAAFHGLFIVGWIQAKQHRGSAHHWLMFGGMIAMLAFFTSYYLFRSLGVLAFEGKEGFGGSEGSTARVRARPDCAYRARHDRPCHGRVYDRSRVSRAGHRRGKTHSANHGITDELGQSAFDSRAFLTGVIAAYLLFLVTVNRFGMGKLVVWASLIVIVAFILY